MHETDTEVGEEEVLGVDLVTSSSKTETKSCSVLCTHSALADAVS